MTRQERAYRLVYQDGTISRAMTRAEAEVGFVMGFGNDWPRVAEIVHVVRRRADAFREEAKA